MMTREYGMIPLAKLTLMPWKVVHVDLVGSWMIQITQVDQRIDAKILVLTCNNAATTWPELISITNKEGWMVTKAFINEWLCLYPRRQQVVHDNGSKLMCREFRELLASYGCKSKAITVKNLQASAIVEQVYKTTVECSKHNNVPVTTGKTRLTTPSKWSHGPSD